MMLVLLALLVAMLTVGFARSLPLEQIAAAVPAATLFVILAASDKVERNLRTLLASTGLLTLVAGLVSFSGGALQVHLLFPLALGAIGLYHDRLAWAAGVGYVTFFYLVLALQAPQLVYPPGLPTGEVVRWSLALWGASLLTAGLALVEWRLSATAQVESSALSVALAESSDRQRQATELHDTVVQELVTAKYALQAGESDLAERALSTALEHTQGMIDSLLVTTGVDLASALIRDDPSQPEEERE